MRHAVVIAAALFFTLPGCDLLKKKAGADAGSAAAAGDADAPAAKAAANTAPGARTIEGIGEVPTWSPDKGSTAKCTPSPGARTRFKAIEKGDDPLLIAGTADVPGLSKEVGADECFASRKGLAEALNNGGYKRYGVKKFDEASRFWRASLTVRPAFLLARYNLACGLALAGKGKEAVAQIVEIAHASAEGDAGASNFLEKSKSDDDLKSVRDDALFKEALRASQGNLVGPRKGSSEPELGAKAIPLLPEEFRKVKDTMGVTTTGVVTYKPAVVNIWTWRPDSANELVVTTITDDPATLGKPRGDLNFNYGALAVYRRDGEKLTLLLSRKTGESPPAVAAGKNGTVAYSFEHACGTLTGVLSFAGSKVAVKEKTCQELSSGAPSPSAAAPSPVSPAKGCKAGEILAADECALKCDPGAPRCPAGKKCDVARFRGEGGGFITEHICQ